MSGEKRGQETEKKKKPESREQSGTSVRHIIRGTWICAELDDHAHNVSIGVTASGEQRRTVSMLNSKDVNE